VVGCLDNQEVEFQCGCSSMYFWGFRRSQSTQVPLQCELPAILPPTLVANFKYANWHRVCKMGAEVTPLPCAAQSSNVTDAARVDLGEGAGIDRLGMENSLAPLHHGFYSGIEALSNGITKFSFEQKAASFKCAIDGTPCQKELSLVMDWAQKNELNELDNIGFKFAPGHRRWVEHGQSLEDPSLRCGAVFTFGLAVCNRGPIVTVECDSGYTGKVQEFKMGCRCEGGLVTGRLLGYMSGEIAGVCAGKMQDWSKQMEASYMRTEPAEVCAAKALEQCKNRYKDEARNAAVAASIQYTRKNNKLMRLQIAEEQIARQNHNEAEVVESIGKRLSQPMYAYTKVPGFGFADDASESESNAHCRMMCDRTGGCKSYSYNNAKKLCAMSSRTLAYDDEFVLYIRKSTPSSGGSFIAIPGMKTDVEEDLKGKSTGLAACQFDCVGSERCKAVSYSKARKICIRSEEVLKLGSEWDYFEKGKLQVIPDLSEDAHAVPVENFFEPSVMNTMRQSQTDTIKTAVSTVRSQMQQINSGAGEGN